MMVVFVTSWGVLCDHSHLRSGVKVGGATWAGQSQQIVGVSDLCLFSALVPPV